MITWKPTSESYRYRKGGSDPAGSKNLACMKRFDELAGEISENSPLGSKPGKGYLLSKLERQGDREGFREVRGVIVLGAWESHVHGEGLQGTVAKNGIEDQRIV